jgi:hypothetical protein
VLNSTERNELNVEDHSVLWEFKDVFLEEVHGLNPKRDLDFLIDLVLGAISTSKVSYRMSTPELVEMKLQLKELLDEGYIKPSISLWGAPALFVNKKDGTLRLCIDYR